MERILTADTPPVDPFESSSAHFSGQNHGTEASIEPSVEDVRKVLGDLKLSPEEIEEFIRLAHLDKRSTPIEPTDLSYY